MQAAPVVQTPSWGAPQKDPKSSQEESDRDAAGPKTWRGHGEFQVSLASSCQDSGM